MQQEGLSLSGVTIAVVDDEPSIVDVLTIYFRSQGARTRGFTSASKFIEALNWSPEIDCIILDLRLDKADGLELLSSIRSNSIAAPVIIITGHGDIVTAVRAMKMGAADFLEKPFTPDQLSTVIQTTLISFRSELRNSSDRQRAEESLSRLTARQLEIVDLISSGLTSKEIGLKLNISFRTVETHRYHIMEMLNCKSMAELIRLSILGSGVPR